MAAERESPAPHLRIAPTGWVIQGKWFVVPFVVVLALLLAWTLGIAFQFQAIMTRLDRARTVWPAASQDLAQRFAQFDALLAAADPAVAQVDAGAWRTAYAAFQETSQYDRQLGHAAVLERIREQTLGPANPPATPAIDQLLATEQDRLAAQRSMIGRWATTALRLQLPGTFSESK